MKIKTDRHDVLIYIKEGGLQKAVSSILEDGGVKTLMTPDRQEMFRLLEEYDPAVVILEEGLPKIFGLEVNEVIKRIDRFNDIKIIVISSLSKSHLGADECIERGRIQDLLLPKVKSFMSDDENPLSLRERDRVRVGLSSGENDDCEDVQYEGGGYTSNQGDSEPEMQMHEEARRFARIIISDIVLYNRDKAEKGVRDGTFHELLKKEIEEGKRFYSNRVSPTVLAMRDYYDEAIREFISKGSRL